MREPQLTIAHVIGDPKKLDAELTAFRKSTRILSSSRANLIAKYPKKWIAIYDGRVQATARTMEQLLAAVDAKGLPRRGVAIRYIDRNRRRMVL